MSNLASSPSLKKGEDLGRLVDMVEYQSGAVVSRILIKSDGGNLTIFAFDKNEGLSEHTTPHDALALVLEGEVGIDIQAQTFTLKAGDFIRLPAQIPHALHAVDKMKMALMLFLE